MVNKTGMDNRASALENRFSPIVMQEASGALSKLQTVALFQPIWVFSCFSCSSCCLLVLLKMSLVNAKNVQLSQRCKEFLLFCLKIT